MHHSGETSRWTRRGKQWFGPTLTLVVALLVPAGTQARGSETVLVAEDEAALRRLVHRILTGAGYTLLVAENRPEALSVVEEGTGWVDLRLTDVVMPYLSGTDLAGEPRVRRPGRKVLYMSGYTARLSVAEGMPFIGKPFSTEGLPRKVCEVLDG